MASPLPLSLAQLNVPHLVQHNQYKNIIKLKPKFKSNPNVINPFLLIAFIRLNRFHNALALFDAREEDPIPVQSYPFEYCYCLYRTFKLKLALSTLNNECLQLPTSATSTKCLILKAQILYRLNDFNGCLDIYSSLISRFSKSDCTDFSLTDVLINQQAAIASKTLYSHTYSPYPSLTQDVHVSENTSYELLFNLASASFGHGDLNTALHLLIKCTKLGFAQLSELQLSDHDINLQLVPCFLQLATVHQFLGHKEVAIDLYNFILSVTCSPYNLECVIAFNNLLSITLWDGHDNFNRMKRFNKWIQILRNSPNFGIPGWQLDILCTNHIIISHCLNVSMDSFDSSLMSKNMIAQTWHAFIKNLPFPVYNKTESPFTPLYITHAHLQRELGPALSSPNSNKVMGEKLTKICKAHPNYVALATISARLSICSTDCNSGVEIAQTALDLIGATDQYLPPSDVFELRSFLWGQVGKDWGRAVDSSETQMANLKTNQGSEHPVMAHLEQSQYETARALHVANLSRVNAEEAMQEIATNPLDVEESAPKAGLNELNSLWKGFVTHPAKNDLTDAPIPCKRRRRYPKSWTPDTLNATHTPNLDQWIPKRLRNKANLASTGRQRSGTRKGKRGKLAVMKSGAHQGGAIMNDPIPNAGSLVTGSARIKLSGTDI